MTSPHLLAALASAAVRGLDPASAAAVAPARHEDAVTAAVEDTQGRRWLVRLPHTVTDAAGVDRSEELLALLAGRLPVETPRAAGQLQLKDGRVATVTPWPQGAALTAAHLAQPRTRSSLAAALRALHDTDPRLAEEAGLDAYDAPTWRQRRLSLLDRAAGTGAVPAGLLARWERVFDDIPAWRFRPCLVHGDLHPEAIRLGDDGHVQALTSWARARVADPADDLAGLVATMPGGLVAALVHELAPGGEPAAGDRAEALLCRARLSAEMASLTELLRAERDGDRDRRAELAAALRDLDEATADQPAAAT